MSIIKDEKFDGVTAPTNPSGWTFASGFVTTSSPTSSGGAITPTSSPNVLDLPNRSGNGQFFAIYGTIDPGNGDVSVQCNINASSVTHALAHGLVARASATSVSSSSGNYYLAVLDAFNQIAQLYKCSSGSQATIGPQLNNYNYYGDEWLQATLNVSGSSPVTVALSVQDIGSGPNAGLWLNSSGIWQSGATDAITYTDSSSPITGVGYAGLVGQNRSDTGLYFDDWIFSTYSPSSSGSIAATESHDVGSISGYSEHATISATEGHDVGSIAGYSEHATIAATDGHDIGSIVGGVPDSILTTQDGADSSAIAAVFASLGTMSPTEAHDAPAMFGFFPAGVLSATESGDSASMAGTPLFLGTTTATERPDIGTIAATPFVSGHIAATESGDVGSLSGSITVHARMTAGESGDRAAISASIVSVSALAAQEAGDRAAILVHAEGIPPSFRVRESGDVAQILGGHPTVHYDVYMSPAVGQPIDYDTPVATTAGLTWTSGPLLVPGPWSFGVRAANLYGEEQNLDCSVTVLFDANGNDISNVPPPPVGLRAFPTAGAKIKVEWSAGLPSANPKKRPSGFHVYMSAGTSLSYSSPAATVSATTGITAGGAIAGAYQTTLQGVDGTLYTIGVRAFNSVAEEANTTTVTATADGTGPLDVSNLLITLVP